jgi:hypothetical protein
MAFLNSFWDIDMISEERWYRAHLIQVSECVSNDPASDVVKSNIITVTVLPADDPAPTQQ